METALLAHVAPPARRDQPAFRYLADRQLSAPALFRPCAFPIERLPVAGPVGFDRAFDTVASDFAFVFGGHLPSLALADDCEADLIARDLAILNRSFVIVADRGTGQFVSILFQLQRPFDAVAIAEDQRRIPVTARGAAALAASRLACQSSPWVSPLMSNSALPVILSPASLPEYLMTNSCPLKSRFTLKLMSLPLSVPSLISALPNWLV